MKEKIKIDIAPDVVCPWCLIGYKHLELAISEIGIEDAIEIEWHPFELNPDMSLEGEPVLSYSSRKYGASPKETFRSQAHLKNWALNLGLHSIFSKK